MASPAQRLAEASDEDRAARAARAAIAQALRERLALAKDLDGEIAALIEQALARISAVLAEAPSDYQQWVLPRLAENIRRVADALAATAGARAADALRRAWGLGQQAVAAPVQAETAVLAGATAGSAAGRIAVDVVADLAAPDLRQLRAMQQFTTHLITGATEDTVNRINRILGQVVLGALQPFDATKAVGRLLPGRTEGQLRGIVNSNLAAAFNSASFAELQRQAARDPALRKQWRRSGKVNSRDNHDAADGQVQGVEQPFELLPGDGKGGIVKIMFPADPRAPLKETINCGCVALAWKASWKMKSAGAKPLTKEEAAAKAGRRAAPRPGRKKTPPQTTQARALAAFPTGRLRDVTGQPVIVDERLLAPASGDSRLVAAGRDLAAYWLVQGLRRPTEVWQLERYDMDSGEIVRARRFVKKFSAGGATWLAWAELRFDEAAAAWVGERAWQIARAEGQLEQLLNQVRSGVRVWPRRR